MAKELRQLVLASSGRGVQPQQWRRWGLWALVQLLDVLGRDGRKNPAPPPLGPTGLMCALMTWKAPCLGSGWVTGAPRPAQGDPELSLSVLQQSE
ncbi:hypothetical protein P7K49_011794 [Saguinus oedipus]|uniref:Uncharacterized protein n=1 Tax=Saguinus oedipus TaxID=9490 RepID=A0ABQ9VRZ5_SAGOE|nr:hypothetical protein P7K49_011794 [Saguinus oedipus]